MSILELHQREKRLLFKWNARKYYDHPDGEDLMGKLSFVLKNTAAVSTIFGVLYAKKHPNLNPTGKLLKIAKFTIPGVAMGFTFTCVTYFSTVFRKKDDSFNHGLGGAAAGIIVGPAMGMPGFSVTAAIFLGTFAYMNKLLHSKGIKFRGEYYKRTYSPFFARELNTSRVAEVKGNWTKDL